MQKLHSLSIWLLTLSSLVTDILGFIGLGLRPKLALTAENLFLRKQLALYFEPETRPRRASAAARLTQVWPSRSFAWRSPHGFATGGILAVSHSPILQCRCQADPGWLASRIWTREVRSLKAGHESGNADFLRITTAEREAALVMVRKRPGGQRVTLASSVGTLPWVFGQRKENPIFNRGLSTEPKASEGGRDWIGTIVSRCQSLATECGLQELSL